MSTLPTLGNVLALDISATKNYKMSRVTACRFVNKVGLGSRCRLRHGILTFQTATSCHSWRIENGERSRWHRPRS